MCPEKAALFTGAINFFEHILVQPPARSSAVLGFGLNSAFGPELCTWLIRKRYIYLIKLC